MKIILLRDVKGVGRKWEEKDVADGYGNNFLLPHKLAVAAGSVAAAQVKALRAQEEEKREKLHGKAVSSIAELSGTEVHISVKANDKGHLFASISREDLAKIIREKGLDVSADAILLEHPIKETGTHLVPVCLDSKETHFTLVVDPA